MATAFGVARGWYKRMLCLPESGLFRTVGKGRVRKLCQFGVGPEHQLVQMCKWFCVSLKVLS
jgi:hypothetical protein